MGSDGPPRDRLPMDPKAWLLAAAKPFVQAPVDRRQHHPPSTAAAVGGRTLADADGAYADPATGTLSNLEDLSENGWLRSYHKRGSRSGPSTSEDALITASFKKQTPRWLRRLHKKQQQLMDLDLSQSPEQTAYMLGHTDLAQRFQGAGLSEASRRRPESQLNDPVPVSSSSKPFQARSYRMQVEGVSVSCWSPEGSPFGGIMTQYRDKLTITCKCCSVHRTPRQFAVHAGHSADDAPKVILVNDGLVQPLHAWAVRHNVDVTDACIIQVRMADDGYAARATALHTTSEPSKASGLREVNLLERLRAPVPLPKVVSSNQHSLSPPSVLIEARPRSPVGSFLDLNVPASETTYALQSQPAAAKRVAPISPERRLEPADMQAASVLATVDAGTRQKRRRFDDHHPTIDVIFPPQGFDLNVLSNVNIPEAGQVSLGMPASLYPLLQPRATPTQLIDPAARAEQHVTVHSDALPPLSPPPAAVGKKRGRKPQALEAQHKEPKEASYAERRVLCNVCCASHRQDMVECVACTLTVHKSCYAVDLVPAEPWLCRVCALTLEHQACTFCECKGGAMLKLQARDSNASEGQVHVSRKNRSRPFAASSPSENSAQQRLQAGGVSSDALAVPASTARPFYIRNLATTKVTTRTRMVATLVIIPSREDKQNESSAGSWVHIACALWLSEKLEEEGSSISISSVNRFNNSKCNGCEGRTGAVVASHHTRPVKGSSTSAQKRFAELATKLVMRQPEAVSSNSNQTSTAKSIYTPSTLSYSGHVGSSSSLTFDRTGC
eukprot:jgi/Chlat1/909/Chrsp108S01419